MSCDLDLASNGSLLPEWIQSLPQVESTAFLNCIPTVWKAFLGKVLCRIYCTSCDVIFINRSFKRTEKHTQGTLLRMLVHVRRGVKVEPGASSESHPFDVESYIFIWAAHWLHVTVLPAASTPRIYGLTDI